MKAIDGVQSHNKAKLQSILNKSKHNKNFRITTMKKPKWWYGNWTKTYEIKKK